MIYSISTQDSYKTINTNAYISLCSFKSLTYNKDRTILLEPLQVGIIFIADFLA